MILDYWKGQNKLWKAFWIIGFLGIFIINIISRFIKMYWIDTFFINLRLESNVISLKDKVLFVSGIVLILIFSIYLMWALVSTWRCGSNSKQMIWKVMSRVLLISLVVKFYTSLILDSWEISFNSNQAFTVERSFRTSTINLPNDKSWANVLINDSMGKVLSSLGEPTKKIKKSDGSKIWWYWRINSIKKTDDFINAVEPTGLIFIVYFDKIGKVKNKEKVYK